MNTVVAESESKDTPAISMVPDVVPLASAQKAGSTVLVVPSKSNKDEVFLTQKAGKLYYHI